MLIPEVEEVESRRALDRELVAPFKLINDVGRQVVDDEIGRALAELEARASCRREPPS